MNTHNATSPNITPAATVVLAREHAGKLQVYLLKRSAKSGFMAGKFVFPGGTVDREDLQFERFHKHCDLIPEEIFIRFGPDLTVHLALAYCVAAIRETLEEAGIFLAHRDDAAAADLERICSMRLDLDLEKEWFVRLVENENWCLALSALTRWSHWITPVRMKRRYDTRFFIGQMPAGQICRPDARETVRGLWLSPEEALAGNLTGEVPLSPPTLISLHELSKFRKLEDLQVEADQRPWGRPIQPRLIPLSEGAVIVEPWDPLYDQKEFEITPEDLPKSVLPVGESFSRLWLDQGIWKPVGI